MLVQQSIYINNVSHGGVALNPEELLSKAVRLALDQWLSLTAPAVRAAALEDPAQLSHYLGTLVEDALSADAVHSDAVRQSALNTFSIHLRNVFEPGELPPTPEKFLFVPTCEGTVAGRAAVLAVHGFLNLETVSYGSENDGALFVNLVPMSGEGRMADKSKAKMRGHTDAVSFPFSGEADPHNPRIAPSPDFVTLIGLKNPRSVGTTVMPLDAILPRLDADVIAELKKAQYSIRTQQTFEQGILDELGKAYTLLDAPLLRDYAGTTHVRFSHSKVDGPDNNNEADDAVTKFKDACEAVAEPVVIQPGDVLMVSNRTCLHGRGVIGEVIGGDARWLLRTYALDTTELGDERRHLDDRAPHVLYP